MDYIIVEYHSLSFSTLSDRLMMFDALCFQELEEDNAKLLNQLSECCCNEKVCCVQSWFAFIGHWF